MDIRKLRTRLGETQSEFAERYGIPFRTIQNWEAGIRKPPEYVITLLEKQINKDLINHKTAFLPEYSKQKKNLPSRGNYLGATSWLKAVGECLGDSAVFALDQALMAQGNFGGRTEEYLIWVYGDDSVTQYNGVIVIGSHISPYDVVTKNGLRYTDFNRTLTDSLANESILDMQGITEGLSNYYYTHNESFDGLFIPPEYQKRFESIAEDAICYYNS